MIQNEKSIFIYNHTWHNVYMLRISSCLSKIITSKHWHIPNADTGFPELHVTSLQGSKTEYFNVNELTNSLDIKIKSWNIILCRIHNSPGVVVFEGSSVVVVVVGSKACK